MSRPEATPPTVLLLGCGRMGSAMLAGWRAIGLGPSVIVDPALHDAGRPEDQVAAALEDVAADFRPDAVILAVKPQLAQAVLPALAARTGSGLVISVMAGRSLASLQAALPDAAIVRCMPNTPAAIGQGMTVLVAGPQVSASQRSLAEALMGASGDTAWIDDEALMDAVTAVSGSGPAYIFLLAELMEKTGIELGLPPDLARRLARKTVSGAGALLNASDEDAAALRRGVTSPNGTTERALAVLMAADAWPDSLRRALTACADRSRELAA
jgi:pyrroline-5-carboxylate reductase